MTSKPIERQIYTNDSWLGRAVFQLTAFTMLWHASDMSWWLFLVPFGAGSLMNILRRLNNSEALIDKINRAFTEDPKGSRTPGQ